MTTERLDIGGLGMLWFSSWVNRRSGFSTSCQSQRLSVRKVSDMNALSVTVLSGVCEVSSSWKSVQAGVS